MFKYNDICYQVSFLEMNRRSIDRRRSFDIDINHSPSADIDAFPIHWSMKVGFNLLEVLKRVDSRIRYLNLLLSTESYTVNAVRNDPALI